MLNYNPVEGYVFDGKYDCNGDLGIMGNYKVTYKGDCLTANILWFVDVTGKLVAPAYMDMINGFAPISSDWVESAETFDADMLRFVKSNKPYFCSIPKDVITCNLRLKFDEEGNILEDSEYEFFVPRKAQLEKSPDGKTSAKWVCEKLVAGKANEDMFLWHQEEAVLNGYIERIKQQLTKEICQDRLSFLKYIVQDR